MVNKLDEKTISQIAAGEVVERLASIVKELIENSIDAKADQILVSVKEKESGIEITVKDNGIGMSEEDIIKSIENHSTSKISSIDDLSNIHSYGFRGEALASIASISKMTIESKEMNSKIGKRVVFQEKKEIGNEIASMNNGTRIIIEDIFYNIPARKKFLKSFSTEFVHISKQFINISLVNPNVSFELIKNSKTLYKFQKRENVDDRIKEAVYKDIEESFIKINYESDFRIKGYIEIPDKANRRAEQYIFVNGRYINDKIISTAIIRGYEGFIMKEQRPRYILMIEIDPREVDINVHPRKLEVRFRDTDYIFRAIQQTIRSSIEQRNIKKLEAYKYNVPQISSGGINNEKSRNASDYVNNFNNYADTFNNSNANFRVDYSINPVSQPYPQFKFDNNHELTNKKYYQIFDSYILVIEKDKVIMIDQHAAAERITYEKLENIQKENIKIMLLPIKYELDKVSIDLIKENRSVIESYGILFELDKDNIIINAFPNFIESTDLKDIIEELVTDFKEVQNNIKISEEKKDHIRATLACHTSIRANKRLTDLEMASLVDELYNSQNPMNCPHGRPTMWELTKSDIEKRFKRT